MTHKSRVEIGDIFENPGDPGERIKVVGWNDENEVYVKSWNYVDGEFNEEEHLIDTSYFDGWKRISGNRIAHVKCECGGDAARTTHSDWCPKYKPYKDASLLRLVNIFFKLANIRV